MFRKQIAKEPTDANSYNQLAWLVGNTEGNYQEALECSLKSLELRPNTAAYLDTLGRCYYAAKDYHNALKHQRMAVERDPHSKQMRRQLALFEKAVEGQSPKK
jgi:tetratricopeptide (TPR) repeat protein